MRGMPQCLCFLMFMLFDSETMIDWLGVPKDEDLPSTFHVQYVRAWKNKETSPDWQKRFRMRFPTEERPTGPTRYVREMQKKKEES